MVTSGVVLAAAPSTAKPPTPTLIDVTEPAPEDSQNSAAKSKKTKNNEKALLLSDDEFQ